MSRRGRRAAMLAAALTVTVAAGVAGGAPTAVAGDAASPVRAGLAALVDADGFPAATAAVRRGDGRTRDYTAGRADLGSGAPVPPDGRFRVGSTTKTFTAVTVLQLVGEGRVRLDEPIETYLPGLVRGEGIDGRAITVRQLLQHTSGLPNYTAVLGGDWFDIRHRYYEPRELLDIALAHPANFAPGTRWEYNNTNYLLAGLIVQRVTGRPLAEEIDNRIIRRAGLTETYFPPVGEQRIRGAHPRGYHRPAPGEPLRDITTLDPSWAWAAGQIVSTPRDINAFFGALLAGRLLGAAELAQMRTTVEAPGTWAGARYGLGLFSTPLTCGGLVWGHGGDIPGYESRGGATDDGRAVTVVVTALPETEAAAQHVLDVVDTALCR
ncbi:serine hydrolase domain-containing protein [Catenuloplanes niger JCM 9533]|uniref:D-alanyl-D-alanine carboxypeptidase n=2 Tax=Micromonosporaceae TaxID=28056 RepID=A0AAE4CQ52_9ACTN|nr:D-alanyl-D-alanine carboxypeptidase [Catenuloplanes niger]